MIKPKLKEPILSDEIVSIIKRASGDDRPINQTVYNNTFDVVRYKTKIMDCLTSNEDILRTLHHPEYSLKEKLNGDDFRFVAIFPFMKVPKDKSDVQNYICFDVQTTAQGKGCFNQIVFRLISHDDDIETEWGISRLDLFDLIISNSFDWTNMFGMTFIRVQDQYYTTSDGYNYRDITYESYNPNNLYKSVNR